MSLLQKIEAKRNQKIKKDKKKKAAIATAGVLIAPKSGKETREDIKKIK